MQGGYQLFDIGNIFNEFTLIYDESWFFDEDILPNDPRFESVKAILSVKKPIVLGGLRVIYNNTTYAIDNLILTRVGMDFIDRNVYSVTQTGLIRSSDFTSGFQIEITYTNSPEEEKINISIYTDWDSI